MGSRYSVQGLVSKNELYNLMLVFWWVRHAPVINNKNCCYGDNEVDCDITNKKQFKSLVKLLPKNAYVYSSPLSRAIKTFQATTKEGLRYKFFFEDKRLKEQNIGKFAGMKYQDLYKLTKRLNIYSPNWLMNETHIPDGGESFIQLNNRVKDFLKDLINEKGKKKFILFSHGGPIRSALNIALNNNTVRVGNFKIDNLRVTKINYVNGKWYIDFINR